MKNYHQGKLPSGISKLPFMKNYHQVVTRKMFLIYSLSKRETSPLLINEIENRGGVNMLSIRTNIFVIYGRWTRFHKLYVVSPLGTRFTYD